MKEKFLDSLGRIHIPKKYREALFITEKMPLEMDVIPEKGEIVIRKSKMCCMLCENTKDLLEIRRGVFLCGKCIRELSTKVK